MDEQDHQHCKVTVRAGYGPGKGYEQFVANSLEKEKLEEVTCNLEPELKGEALVTFLDAVKDGFSIKDCISRVQSQVLHKVPNVRNKFFIKFVYDNQLQIEIGVNKFKNGNAQFYHKLGVQPKETPEKKEEKEVRNTRKITMNELEGSGGFPYVRLKKQVTNDKSAPLVSGHVLNRHGAWEESEAPRQPDQPPNPTNRQTARQTLGNYRPDEVDNGTHRAGWARPLGDIMKNYKPSSVKLRSRSVGRPMKEMKEEEKIELRDRSASPLPSEIRKRGGLGDCFRTGIKPTQSMLRSSGSPIVNKKTTPKFGNNQAFNIVGDNDKGRMKNIKIEVKPQKSEDSGEEWNEEWNEDKEDEVFSPIKIEEIFSPVESTEPKQTFPFPTDYKMPTSPLLAESNEDIDQTEDKIQSVEPQTVIENYKYMESSPYLVTQPDESENDRVETVTNKISKMNDPTVFEFPTYNKIQPLGPQWEELKFSPIVPLSTTMECPPSLQETPLLTQFAPPQIKQKENWVSIPIQRV